MPALIFDLDDTLYPRAQFVRGGLVAVADHAQRQFGVPAGRALDTLLRAQARVPGREYQVLCEAFVIDERHVPELIEVSRSHAVDVRLYEDAAATLATLRADGWRLALLTNGLPRVQRRKVAALGVAALVDAVVYAWEHAPEGKPAPAAFAEALRRLDAAPQDTVMAGDDPVADIRGAREAGLRAIHVCRGTSPVPCGADAVVGALAEVPGAARALLGLGGPPGRAHAA